MQNNNIKTQNIFTFFNKDKKLTYGKKELLTINSGVTAPGCSATILPTLVRKEFLSTDSRSFSKQPAWKTCTDTNIRQEVGKSLALVDDLDLNNKTFSGINNNLPSNYESNLFNNVVKSKLIKLLDTSNKNLDPLVMGNHLQKGNNFGLVTAARWTNRNKNGTELFGKYRLSKIEIYTFNRQNSINNNINNKIKYCFIFLKHIFQNTFISTPNFKITVNKLVITIYYFSYNATANANKGKRGNKEKRGYQAVYSNDFYNINLSLLQVEELLAKLFNINIELRFIKLHYPFLNSNIFANFIGHLTLGNFTSNLINKDSKFLAKKRTINKQLENFEKYSINSINTRTSTKIKNRRRFNLLKLFKKMKFIRVNKQRGAIDNINNNLFNNLKFPGRFVNYNFRGQPDNLYGKNLLAFNNRKTFVRGDSTQFTPIERAGTTNQGLLLNKKSNINNIFDKYQSKLALLGAKYEIAGRMNRRRSATRTSVISRSKGSFKFNSKNSLIDHSKFIYKNKSGSFSVKVWLSSNYSL